MLLGLISYIVFYPKFKKIATKAGKQKMSWIKVFVVILGTIIAIFITGNILEDTKLYTRIVVVIAILGIDIFLYTNVQASIA